MVRYDDTLLSLPMLALLLSPLLALAWWLL